MWYSRWDMPLRRYLAGKARGDGDYGAEVGARSHELGRGSRSPRASSRRRRSTPHNE